MTEKQAKLDERIIKLQQKIFDGLNKFKQDKTLPISEAERNWFKEINSINALVNSSTDNEVGLTKRLRIYRYKFIPLLKIVERRRNQN